MAFLLNLFLIDIACVYLEEDNPHDSPEVHRH